MVGLAILSLLRGLLRTGEYWAAVEWAEAVGIYRRCLFPAVGEKTRSFAGENTPALWSLPASLWI